ncbi:MAG: hypothetical protein E7514_05245 [Ruminococcaceae bacterium]|nr:hypothetical protein [Oscillospiraceae bacterium]
MLLKYENGISIPEALNISLTGILVVMLMLAVLAVLVVLLSKGVRFAESMAKKEQKAPEIKTPVNTEKPVNTVTLPDTDSEGQLDLYKTDEKTAAVIMAIVSDESGIPLNRLKFNSIKLIEK